MRGRGKLSLLAPAPALALALVAAGVASSCARHGGGNNGAPRDQNDQREVLTRPATAHAARCREDVRRLFCPQFPPPELIPR